MTLILEHASPVEKQKGAWVFPTASFLLGWILYLVACLPAIDKGDSLQSAYLQGAIFLWMAAIPLTALFQPWSAGRFWWLAAFAAATAPVDGLATQWSNPPPPFAVNLINSVVYIPVHIIAALLVEGLSRMSGRVFHFFFRGMAPETRSKLGLIAALALVPIVPYIFVAAVDYQGRSRADDHWSSHYAYFITSNNYDFSGPGGITGTYFYDDATGLEVHDDHSFPELWHPAYKARLAALLGRNGRPPWAAPHLPSQADLTTTFESSDFTAIASFPFPVTADITVTGGPLIETKRGVSVGVGGTGPIAFAIDRKDPRIIYFRHARDWMGVFSSDGKFMVTMNRR